MFRRSGLQGGDGPIRVADESKYLREILTAQLGAVDQVLPMSPTSPLSA